MPFLPGDKLGPYEILAPIGAGGMGEVYQARDTKLDREVAIKVLPSALARDPERLARFEREAKVLASLNHPNIAQIYGIEEADSGRALVMELVPGHTLQSPLPLAEALRIAAQTAGALEAAHDKGVVHRDLKPANIMITPAGAVKVLDFGLAATTPSSPAGGDPNNSPTLTMGATQAGMILGTASYMAPEQAAGQFVDKRADIWSFGVVLYEMLTGQRLFTGDSVAHILAAVLRAPIDFDKLPKETPRAIRDLVKRCLDRDVKTRLRDIGEGRIAIHNIGKEPEVVEAIPAQSRVSWLAWGVATLAILAALAVSFVHFHERQPPLLKTSLLPPEKSTISLTGIPAVSPDGLRLAFVAKADREPLLWVRELDSISARPLPGTENASYPFWSPDSRWLGFFADNKLKKIDVTGGPPQALCDAITARGGSWSQNGVIIFATNGSPTFRVAATGGSVTALTTLDPNAGVTGNRFPSFLPDGHHFLVTMDNTNPEKVAVKVGDLDSKELKQVINVPSNAVYVSPGYLLFVRDRTLMAQHFDAGKREASGDAVPLAEQIDSGGSIVSQNQFSASQNGILVYSSGGGAEMEQLIWFDRTGKAAGTVGPPGTIDGIAISPDGKTVAADRRDPQTKTADIWLHELARGAASRFTFVPSNFFPVWSPDGGRLAFYSTRSGGLGHAFQKATSANARDEVLHQPLGNPPRNTRVEDWSRDGRYIIEETEGGGKTANDIWVLPLSGDRQPFPYLQTDFRERLAKLSPDGRWLSYQSDESNRDEIYVQSFPTPGGKWQVSLNGGSHAVWSRDGKELYFIGADHKMMAVQVKTSAGKFEASIPQPLFDVHMPNDINTNSWYDVAPDGRFLIPTQVGEAPLTPLTVVVNWQAALKK